MGSEVHVSWRPVLYQVQKRLGRVQNLSQAASEVVEVFPEESGTKPAAFSLPGELDKVRRVQEETNEEQERRRISAGPLKHLPTLAFRLRQVDMVQGTLFVGRHQLNQSYDRPSPLPRVLTQHLTQVSLPSTRHGTRYFGHFIIDNACTGLLAGDFGPVRWTTSGTPLSDQARRYLEVYGLPQETLCDVRIDEAWVFQDFAMNSHKRGRLATQRSMVRSLPGKRSGHGVFFRRRGAGIPRGLSNEAQIEEVLSRQGFEIIDIVGASVDDIVSRCKDAALIVGVEGSQLVHGLLAMADGAALLCIQPPYRFNNVLKDHADALGFRYAFVVGQGTEDAFELDVDDLLRTIDLVRDLPPWLC